MQIFLADLLRDLAQDEGRRDHHQIRAQGPADDAENLPTVACCTSVGRDGGDDNDEPDRTENISHCNHSVLPVCRVLPLPGR